MLTCCCKIDCPNAATLEILTVRATEHGERLAGPDPYSDFTYACEDHVGALLGYQPDAVDTKSIYWTVREVEQEVASQ